MSSNSANGRNDGNQPDEAASSSPADGTNTEDSDTTTNVVTDTLSALQILHTKRNICDISGAINYLESVVKLEDAQRNAVSKELFDLHGLPTLLFSLEKFRDSESAVAAIMAILCEVTKHDDRFGTILVSLDGIRVILSTAQKHSENAALSADTLSIMLHLNINKDCIDSVVGDDVVDYCLQVSQQFPDHLHLQSTSARYFAEMTRIVGGKDRLLDKRVDRVLLEAFHKFRGNNEYAYERDICKEGLVRLFSNKKARSNNSNKRG